LTKVFCFFFSKKKPSFLVRRLFQFSKSRDLAPDYNLCNRRVALIQLRNLFAEPPQSRNSLIVQ